MARRASLIVVVALAIAIALLPTALGRSASAHGGSASFDVRQVTVTGRDIRIVVAVTYSVDREAAEGALITATAHRAGAMATEPVELERRPGGVYRGTVRVPSTGTWTVTLNSRFPPGSYDVRVRVGEKSNDVAITLVVVATVAVLGALSILLIALGRRRRSGRRPEAGRAAGP